VDTVLVAGRLVKANGRLLGHDARKVIGLAEATRDHVLAAAANDPLISDVRLGGGWIPQNPAAVKREHAGASV